MRKTVLALSLLSLFVTHVPPVKAIESKTLLIAGAITAVVGAGSGFYGYTQEANAAKMKGLPESPQDLRLHSQLVTDLESWQRWYNRLMVLSVLMTASGIGVTIWGRLQQKPAAPPQQAPRNQPVPPAAPPQKLGGITIPGIPGTTELYSCSDGSFQTKNLQINQTVSHPARMISKNIKRFTLMSSAEFNRRLRGAILATPFMIPELRKKPEQMKQVITWFETKVRNAFFTLKTNTDQLTPEQRFVLGILDF